MEQGDIIERLKACANGVGSLKTERGDFGLCEEAAAEITRLRAALAESLIKAYDVGFANSGEGYNGEYGADVSSDYYIQTRTEALDLIDAPKVTP